MDQTGIDAQFNRAVDIVHSLPKGGPVQTTYEEKLWLYSLYKQSTEGDIAIPRPGLLDMLGRAKWDSWHKQKGLPRDLAKRQYVEALLNILRKYGRTAISRNLIAELISYDPSSALPQPLSEASARRVQSRSRSRPRVRSPRSGTESESGSSSGSSYHSSQASPIQSPSPPPSQRHGTVRGADMGLDALNGGSYALPDPEMPIPDVADGFIPPSALNSSHKSLLSLVGAGAGMVNTDVGSTSVRMQAHSLAQRPVYGLEAGHSREASLSGGLRGSEDTRAGVEGKLGGVSQSEQAQDSVHAYSRAMMDQPAHCDNPRLGEASALGFVPIDRTNQPILTDPSQRPIGTPDIPTMSDHVNPRHAHSSASPRVIARDYTPDPNIRFNAQPHSHSHTYSQLNPNAPSISPYLHSYNPHRPGTPSTFTVPPISVPSTLLQIQTSLTALHERLNTLESAQGLILRREQRRKSWGWPWLGGRGEEEEIDEAEEALERERRGLAVGERDSREGAGSGKRDARGGEKKSRLGLIWGLTRMIRRLMVDMTVAGMVGVAVFALIRGWRGDIGRRIRDRYRRLIRDS